jgi:ADP-ribose pyrophosphatase YjhB (NUDIX family)
MSEFEEATWAGRRLTVGWRDETFVPPRSLITQASGDCFTEGGNIVLVSADGETWQLVGAHPEDGETIETAFIREVAEEACATVTAYSYLGAQEVNDPQSPTGLTIYYQARYWARVTLGEFRSKHETIARKCLEPSEVRATLNWHTLGILNTILQAALTYEQNFSKNQASLF